MREPIRDKERLEHIVEAIDNIFSFAKGKTVEDLNNEKILFYAVVKNIEIIGEAAFRLTKEFRQQHSETPWSSIVVMRHVLVHDYYQTKAKRYIRSLMKTCNLFETKLCFTFPRLIGKHGRNKKLRRQNLPFTRTWCNRLAEC